MIRVRIHTSSRELDQLRPLWESLRKSGQGTVFQDFDWNLLAARTFSHREQPFVISAVASFGVAIVPAALRRGDGTLRFLGEELFDYRSFLYDGEEEVLRAALDALGDNGKSLEAVAL